MLCVMESCDWDASVDWKGVTWNCCVTSNFAIQIRVICAILLCISSGAMMFLCGVLCSPVIVRVNSVLGPHLLECG